MEVAAELGVEPELGAVRVGDSERAAEVGLGAARALVEREAVVAPEVRGAAVGMVAQAVVLAEAAAARALAAVARE